MARAVEQRLRHSGLSGGVMARRVEPCGGRTIPRPRPGGIITDKLRSWVLEIFFALEDPKPEPIEASAAQLAEVEGFYDQPMSAFTIEAAPKGLRILSHPRGGFPRPDSPPGPPDPPSRALLIPGDRILCLDEPRKDAIGDFIRDDRGRVAFLRLGGRIHRKLR